MRHDSFGGLDVRIGGGSDGSGGGDGPVVVLLHGFGAPGTDLVPLARILRVPPAVRWVFPAAPLVLEPTLADARAWWRIDLEKLEAAIARGEARDLSRETPAGLAEARERIVLLLGDVERHLGVTQGRLVLGGFSQGAMLSLEVALRTPCALAGLVLLSGTLLCEEQWVPLMGTRRGLAVLQSHGTADPLLPYPIACRLRDRLAEAGLAVEFVSFRGGHEIPSGVLSRLGAFLGSV